MCLYIRTRVGGQNLKVKMVRLKLVKRNYGNKPILYGFDLFVRAFFVFLGVKCSLVCVTTSSLKFDLLECGVVHTHFLVQKLIKIAFKILWAFLRFSCQCRFVLICFDSLLISVRSISFFSSSFLFRFHRIKFPHPDTVSLSVSY